MKIHEHLAWMMIDAGFTMRTDARDFEGRWCLAFDCLCWNLAMASLLGAAADQSHQKLRRQIRCFKIECADLDEELRNARDERDALRAENLALKLRPPMKCVTCEDHNDQLVDRIDRMVEAVCATCADTDAFRASQKWPLDPTPAMTDEEFQAVLVELDGAR